MPARPYRPKTQLEYRSLLENYIRSRNSRITNFDTGSRISTILDAVSWILANGDIDTLNGFQYAILEGVYNAFGFKRLPGKESTGIIRIEYDQHEADFPIPVFTIDLFGLEFKSSAATTIQLGQTSVEIEVKAVLPGQDYNIRANSIDTLDGLGTVNLSLPSGVRFVNTFDFTGGTEFESEESRLQRFQGFIASLNRATPIGIYNAVVQLPGIAGAEVVTNLNPYSKLFETGWINIYISDGTTNPPQELIDLVKNTITGVPSDPVNYPGYAAAGTYVYVSPVPVIGITAKYSLDIQDTTKLTIEDAISIANNAVVRYLNTLPIGYDILFDQIEATILKSHFDFYKVTITELHGRIIDTEALPEGEWIGNVFKSNSNLVPFILPLPVPADISVDVTWLPRTVGSSSGVVEGTGQLVTPL